MGKNKKKDPILSQEEYAFQAAEEQYQEEIEAEMRYKEELLYEGALIERKRIMDSLRKFLENEENAPVKPINANEYRNNCIDNELLIIENVNVINLVNDLEERHFFESKYKTNIISWFRGFLLRNSIPIKVSADTFVSLVADMMDRDPSLIKNTKKMVASNISTSFTFRGKRCTEDTIRQILKPGTHKNRISHLTGKIPNIVNFITKSTT
jgi:hypothetical protein